MRQFLMSACAAAMLGAANTAWADEADTSYYAGSFTCGNTEYATDWNISRTLGGMVSVRVYYQRPGSSSSEWLDLAERSSGAEAILIDADGNPRIEISPKGDSLGARWLNGGPSYECQPFSVTRTESQKARFDALFVLLQTQDPLPEVARQVADISAQPPIAHALPELDQQEYFQRFTSLGEEFWKNYRASLVKQAASRPLSSEEDRKAYARWIGEVSSGNLHFMLRNDGSSMLLSNLQQAADRFAAASGSPSEAFFAGGGQTCQNLAAILKVDRYYDMEKLELASGVPSDYWSRSVAEEILGGLRGCDGVPEDYAQELTRTWPEIQKNQQALKALRQEQARLLALPVSMQTVIDAGLLQPDEQVVRSLSTNSRIYQRFFGAALDPKREELMKASVAAITELSTGHFADKPESAKSIEAVCSALRQGVDRSSGSREEIDTKCEAAEASVAEKVAVRVVAEVRTAFTGAVPGTPAAEQAVKLCEDLHSALDGAALLKASAACREERAALEEKEEALKCERAIAASGASEDLLSSTIEVFDPSEASGAALSELVCAMTKRNAQVAFSSTGVLMWEKQHMSVTIGKDTHTFLLESAEGEADWRLAAEDEKTLQEMARQKVAIERVTACFMGRPSCVM